MGVVPAGAELSRATVVALLGEVLGNDPDLHEGVGAGEYAEIDWKTERISTQWLVHPGAVGVTELVVSVWDRHPLRPVAEYRSDVGRVADVLQRLARATGGRFVVEEADATTMPLPRILDLVAADDGDRTPAGVVLDPVFEPDDAFLRRYLAAGDSRLAWLREQGAPGPFDDSRDSLAPLWGWAIRRLRPRTADAPREKVMNEQGATYQRPVGAVLPMWYGRKAALALDFWSDDALAVLDAVAFYAAECVRHAVPELSWQAGREDEWGNMHEGLPVLAGHGRSIQPIAGLTPVARSVYRMLVPHPADPRPAPAPEDLRDWYDAVVADHR